MLGSPRPTHDPDNPRPGRKFYEKQNAVVGPNESAAKGKTQKKGTEGGGHDREEACESPANKNSALSDTSVRVVSVYVLVSWPCVRGLFPNNKKRRWIYIYNTIAKQ